MNQRRKAYCGDGLLRYCLGKIFFVHGNVKYEYVTKLEANRILAIVVLRNPDIFGMHKSIRSTTNFHTLGTLFEAFLFDLHEKEGTDKCVEFIKKTFEITEKRSKNAYETYCNIVSWASIAKSEPKEEPVSKEYPKATITSDTQVLKRNDIITNREAIMYKLKR